MLLVTILWDCPVFVHVLVLRHAVCLSVAKHADVIVRANIASSYRVDYMFSALVASCVSNIKARCNRFVLYDIRDVSVNSSMTVNAS